jgi:hypothetical protein
MLQYAVTVLGSWFLTSVFASLVLGRMMSYGAAVDAPSLDSGRAVHQLAS